MEYFSFTETDKFRIKAARLIGEDEIAEVQVLLCGHPKDGAVIPASGGIRKLRWSASGHGKRGGARIIAHVRIVEDKAYLVSIYDKADYNDVSEDVLKEFMRDNKPPQ